MSDPSVSPQPIVALDVPSLAAARDVVARLDHRADFYKVGLQLFIAEGPAVVGWLRALGKRVFLDLKLHDIPNTVRLSVERAASMGVELVTVHGLGGTRMIEAAVLGAGAEAGVLVVTVLTSMDAADLARATGRPLSSAREEVLRLATDARSAGAHGVVCGGAECRAVLDAAGAPLRVLVPGIRPAGAAADDQRRLTTPEEARHAGASYAVFGRAVTAAADPAAAFDTLARALRG